MNPQDLTASSASRLCSYLRRALATKDVDAANDALMQVESRFRRMTVTVKGSEKFLDEFLDLGGSTEVRSLNVGDPFIRCAARLEYLLELAGEQARAHTQEATLRQIVTSRERGFDLIRALAAAPEEGLTASKLATRLRISRSNLSPLIGAFYVHGVINRVQRGKHVFIQLTPQGWGMLRSDTAEVKDKESSIADEEVFGVLVDGNVINEEIGSQIWREAMREVTHDMRQTPFQSKRGRLGAAQHAMRRVEERICRSNPVAAGILRTFSEEIKRSIGIVSEAARQVADEVLNELRSSAGSSQQATADIVQIELARKEELHRETAPLASLIFHTVGEVVKQHAA